MEKVVQLEITLRWILPEKVFTDCEEKIDFFMLLLILLICENKIDFLCFYYCCFVSLFWGGR